MNTLTHLEALESEAIHILREAVAQAENPVLLFSAGKDSTVLAHLALRAFYPSRPPMPLLHVDSTWEFRELLEFRDSFAREHGLPLVVYANEEGRALGLNPIDHGDRYTTMMRTEALKKALDRGGYDVIFGGARRDEEKSRAKERIFSIRNAQHGWEPRQQRPELWNCYNGKVFKGQSVRVFPLSNWTELDLWSYIYARRIKLAPLYYAKDRAVIRQDGTLIALDEPERLPSLAQKKLETRRVRFRTLGCWPVTGAIESDATETRSIIQETLLAPTSERRGRVSDEGSLELQKRQGYF